MSAGRTEVVAELIRAATQAKRWLGKAVADDAFAGCVNPAAALVDLAALEMAIEKVTAA